MSNISSHVSSFTASFEQQNQPWTEMVQQRMQRLQELEQLRRERTANHGSLNESESRHSRRERIIQQTTRGGRHSYRTGIQRTPIRSQSFEIDTQPFIEVEENARQGLFGPRLTGSSENVHGLGMTRRDSDTNLLLRALGQTGSDSGSDSSIPTSLGNWNNNGLTGAQNISFHGSDTNLNREPRSSSMTRETRDSSVNRRRMRPSDIVGDTSLSSRLYSRQPRSRDARRRRTIQGTDKNVVEALEREKLSFEPFSRLSPNFMATSDSDLNTAPAYEKNDQQQYEDGSSYTPEKTPAYRPKSSYRRKITLKPDDSLPIIAVENEKIIFVHKDGKTYWLDKRHPLMRYFKSPAMIPEITVDPPNETEEDMGIVESIDGEADFRYDRVRDICNISVKKSGEDDTEPFPTGDEERYQSRSYYTPPRERPSVESYFTSKHIISLYDGIDMTIFEVGHDATSTLNSEQTESESLHSSNIVNGTSDNHQSEENGHQEMEIEANINDDNTNNSSVEIERNDNDRITEESDTVDENTVSEVSEHCEEPMNSERNNDTNTELSYESNENYTGGFFQNEQMLIRQTIIEHHLETVEELDKPAIDDSLADRNEPLMSNLQVVHESVGVPLDTSHMDHEEPQMIEKAISENPSPSPPSSPVQGHLDPEPNYLQPVRESVVARPELGTILESPGRLQLPSMDFSPLEKDKASESFTFSPTSVSKSVEEITQSSEPVEEHDEDNDGETFTFTEVYEQEIIIPFPQSPSSSGESPNSISPANADYETTTVATDITPLAIEIPGDSEIGSNLQYGGTEAQSHSNSSSVSPLVKSEKGSDGTQSQASPSQTETVTTVFEEFVSTIPHDMLDSWSP